MTTCRLRAACPQIQDVEGAVPAVERCPPAPPRVRRQAVSEHGSMVNLSAFKAPGPEIAGSTAGG